MDQSEAGLNFTPASIIETNIKFLKRLSSAHVRMCHKCVLSLIFLVNLVCRTKWTITFIFISTM